MSDFQSPLNYNILVAGLLSVSKFGTSNLTGVTHSEEKRYSKKLYSNNETHPVH